MGKPGRSPARIRSAIQPAYAVNDNGDLKNWPSFGMRNLPLRTIQDLRSLLETLSSGTPGSDEYVRTGPVRLKKEAR